MTDRLAPQRVAKLGAHVSLIAVCIVFALPMVWAIKSSFTPTGEVLSTGLFDVPSRLTLENFSGGLESAPFALYFANSFIVAVVVTLTTVISSATAGYGFARFDFAGKRLIFVLVLGAMMMPFQAIMIPLFVEVKTFGWIDSFAGLIIPGAVSAFGIFMMRQFMRAIPVGILEAAKLDGASEWGVFVRIVVPLARGPLSALGALTFLASWNNFLWPLIVIQSQHLLTVPIGLAQFRGSNATDYGQILAVSILGAIPAIIVFLIMRRRIVSSFVSSGLK